MSLTRVSSVDGFERERRGSNVSSRRMSFNPFTDQMPSTTDRKHSIVTTSLPFEEISKRKRIGRFVRWCRRSLLTDVI
jgi:hypothetical protein